MMSNLKRNGRMKRIYSLAAVAAVMLAAASCTHEEAGVHHPDGETVIFTATIGDADTRAGLGISENGRPQTMWNDGDRITIHNGSRRYEFITSLEEPAPRADFTYVGNDFTAENGVIAVYPSGSYTADLTERTVTLNIPSMQTAVAGTFDPSAGVLAAYSHTSSMAFMNAAALVKFSLKTEGVKSVVLSGLGDEAVCGETLVTFDENGGIASVKAKADGSTGTSVELTAAEGKLETGMTYYMAVAPGTFPQGFTVHVKYAADGEMYMVKGYTKSYELKRNSILNLGDFTVRELPKIHVFSLTSDKNPGKILAKELYYDASGSGGQWTKNREASAPEITVSDGLISGTILYLNDRNLVPDMVVTDGAKISYRVEGGDFTEWDGTSAIDLSSGTVIRVSKDGIFNDYKCALTNSGLPVVVVNQPDGDTSWPQVGEQVWSKVDFDKITAGEITVYNADGIVDLATSVARTRLRGNTSLNFPKKPFAVKLDNKASVLGMAKHKRWVLLANWKDKSLMRNHVAFGLAQKFAETLPDGIPWQVHGRFVELVYNGVHVGNYYLCEQIKIDSKRLNINDEYDAEKFPTITSDQVGQFGYLMECDDYWDENTKFVTRHYIPFQFKDDGDAGNVIKNYVQDKVQGIEDNLYKGNYSTAYNDLDINSFADYLLINELAMNSEIGHPRSFYVYMNGTGKLCAGPVWDFDWQSFPIHNGVIDQLLGSAWDRDYGQSLLATSSHKNKHYRYEPIFGSGTPSSPRTDDVPYMWYPMLVKDGTFKALLAERWGKISGDLADYTDSLITATAKEIAVSWEYNNSIWPAYYSDNCDRQAAFSGGFCGDELMTDFEDIHEALIGACKDRIDGMNGFVKNQTWPTWSIQVKRW